MVSPSKIPSISLPLEVIRNSFGNGQAGLYTLEPLDRARAEHDHAMRGLAAQRLLPGEGRHVELGPIEPLRERGGSGVADGQARAVGGDPVAVGHAHAGGRAVPGEDDVVAEIDLCEIRQRTIGRLQRSDVPELQLLDDVGNPALAETLPGENLHSLARPAATTTPFRRRRCPTRG